MKASQWEEIIFFSGWLKIDYLSPVTKMRDVFIV